MATRVNTRFVLILAVTLFTAVGIVGGLWVLQIRSDTTRHIKAGDALMVRARAATDSGDPDDGQALYEQALKQYGRAVTKEPEELSHLRKLETVLASMRPTTQDRAAELEAMRVEVLRHEVRYRRQDPEAHMNLIRELHRLARQFNQTGAWQQLADAADDLYKSVPSPDPLDPDPAPLLYRGMGNVRAYGLAGMGPISSTATPEEIKDAEADLQKYVDEYEKDDLGWATLAESKLSIARQHRADNRKREADLAYMQAEETLAQALANVPDGPEVARVKALRLALQRFEEKDDSVDDELKAAVDRMEQLAAASDDPLLLADVTEIIRTTDFRTGLPRSVDLMRAYVDAHPDELYQRLQLAKLCYLARDHDPAYLSEARAAADVVIAAEPVPVSTLSKIQSLLRISAAGLIVDVEYHRWMNAEEADKPELLNLIVVATAALKDLVAEPEKDVTYIRAEGKIAAARNDFRAAVDRFEKALELARTEDFETLWNAARCQEQIGNYGRSCERLEQAHRLRPTNIIVLAEKARMEFRVGRFDDAWASAHGVLAIDPTHERAKQIVFAIRAENPEVLGASVTDKAEQAVLQAKELVEGGDLAGARDALLGAMEKAADKTTLLSELIKVEMLADKMEQALVYVDQALAVHPNNQFLHKLRISLSNEDQIEALKEWMEEAYDNDSERAIQTLVELRKLARNLDEIAERQTALGDDETARQTRARADDAREEAEQFLVRATELAPDHASLIDHLFNEVLLAKDLPEQEKLAELERLTERARAVDADQAGGLIFRGRLEIYKGDYERAVQTLTDATIRKNWSALAWRLLGRAHELLGHLDDALQAYEEAYTCNPNDAFAVRWYVNLLVQKGDQTRALRILRSVQRTQYAGDELRDLWIQLEASVGELAVAIDERRTRYEQSSDLRVPEDQLNAMRLVALLGRAKPSYEHVVTQDGQRKYGANHWTLLSDQDRQEELAEVAANWEKYSNNIIVALKEATGGDSLDVAWLQAEAHRARGEVAAGEEVLRAFFESHRDDPAQPLLALIRLGRYQANVNHFGAAADTYRAAREFQSEDQREADRALADLQFNQSRWAQAEEAYRELAETLPKPGSNVLLRLAECYLKLQQYEDASATLERAVALPDSGQDFFTAMLSAGIADGHGDQLISQGRTDEADQKYAQGSAALDEAERLQPRSPLPHIRRAQRLTGEFMRTRKMTLLDDAMLHLDRAENVAVGDESISRVRVDIYRLRRADLLAKAANLRSQGDEYGARAAELSAKDPERSAVAELDRLLTRSPGNVAARRLLVQIHAESGSGDRAMATIDEAITRNPTIALWHEAKGDLLVLMSRDAVARDPDAAHLLLSRAVEQFREAYELQPNGGRLAKYGETALVGNEPAYLDVVEMVSAREEFVEGRPLLRSLYALALSGVGRNDEAMEQMRAAYDEHRQLMERQLLETGQVSPAGLVNWLRRLQSVMSDRGPAQYEQFVTELAAGRLDSVEQLYIARVWVTSGPEGLSRAVELVHMALAQCPAEDPALRAQLELDLGQFEVVADNIPAAAAAFERALEIDPKNVLALNNAAYIYAEHMNDPAKALPYAERAVEASPNEGNVLDTLGWTYYRVGRYGEAEDYLRLSTKARPTPDNYLHLARVLFETTKDLSGEAARTRLDTTRTYLNRAAELKPSEELQMEIDRLAEEIEAWASSSGQRRRR
jgi:tetratricopeptide (TPR) repeat protein